VEPEGEALLLLYLGVQRLRTMTGNDRPPGGEDLTSGGELPG
jgi:hypothetical protein